MKKFLKSLLVLALLVFLVGPVYAGRTIGAIILRDAISTNGQWSSYAMAAGTEYTSNGIDIRTQSKEAESMGLLITTNNQNAPISAKYEVSVDDVTFYTPYAIGADSAASSGTVASDIFGDRWIEFDPVTANYIRFKVTAGGAPASVTTVFIMQGDN